ncbi:MAG: transcriptional regulator [Methyloceanibacter sp.]|nr:MAG: transcriptional regulator [Methyloceanibacter sp.]
MAKPANRSYSRYARDAAQLLGVMIHNARIEQALTVAELAERAGLSRGLVHRIENGDTGCSIGAVFELAAILGLRLFDAAPTTLTANLALMHDKLTLLPKAARPVAKTVKDDF